MMNILLIDPCDQLGQHLCYQLLQYKNLKLNIISRDVGLVENRMQSLFTKIDRSVQADYNNPNSNLHKITELIISQKIDLVISTLSSYLKNDQRHTKLIELDLNTIIVQVIKQQQQLYQQQQQQQQQKQQQQCQGRQIKMIYVSRMQVDRPRSFSAYKTNSQMADCLGYKLETERVIRDSQIDYVIVRPDQLIDNQKKDRTSPIDVENIPPEDIYLLQRYNQKGSVHCYSLARLIVNELVLSPTGKPNRFTFGVIGMQRKQEQQYQQILDWSEMDQDKQRQQQFMLRFQDHVEGRIRIRNYLVTVVVLILVTLIVFLILFINRTNTNHQ